MVYAMRVLHVDHLTLFRAALRRLLYEDKLATVVDEASDEGTALAALSAAHYDLVLIDVDLGRTSGGVPLVHNARAAGVTAPILILTANHTPAAVAAAMDAGANGYASKLGDPEELSRAIRSVLNGGRFLAPGVVAAATCSRPQPVDVLTNRERQVFDLLVAGNSARQIAGTLTIGLKTVETHRERIFKKLNVHTIVELVRLAARHQLLDLTPSSLGAPQCASTMRNSSSTANGLRNTQSMSGISVEAVITQ